MYIFFGYELDLFSFIPAVFGAILSIYNWLKSRGGAKLIPESLLNYGMIHSKEHEGAKLIVPFVIHNDGANDGLITKIKMAFKHGDTWKYLKFVGRAHLAELDENTAFQGDWNAFEERGFTILQPTYPIVAPGMESTSVVMVGNAWFVDGTLPEDKETSCKIEIFYGNGKSASIEFPFYLKKEHIIDDVICWYPAISEHPEAE